MTNGKSADEVFCRSCGEAIKKEAEVCPNCGVRNTDSSHSRRAPANTTTYGPQRSKNWWVGIAVSVFLWIAIGAFSYSALNSLAGSPSLGNFGSILGASLLEGLFRLGVWILFPLSMYFDTDYVTEQSNWKPSGAMYAAIGGVLPIIHIIFFAIGLFTTNVSALVAPLLGMTIGLYYLKQRRQFLGAP